MEDLSGALITFANRTTAHSSYSSLLLGYSIMVRPILRSEYAKLTCAVAGNDCVLYDGRSRRESVPSLEKTQPTADRILTRSDDALPRLWCIHSLRRSIR